MRFDLVVRAGTVVLPDTDGVAADIAISGEKIAAVLAPGTPVDAAETLDASGKTVLPGIIDVHLHLGHGKDIARPRVPEDAATETAAAAVGGVTTFVPYLMATDPFETLFEEVKEVTEAGARIDFGYHCIISTEAQLAGVPRYVREFGAPSLKIFMNNRGGEGARLGLPDIDDGFLLRLCEGSKRPRRPARMERHAAAVRGGRCRTARRPVRPPDRRSALHCAHLLAPGPGGRFARP
jgi:dihydropyrimidinase